MNTKRKPNLLSKSEHSQTATTAVSQVSHQFSIYHGPYPDPNIIEGYRRVMPDAPERIFTMIEEETRHRRNIEQCAQAAMIDDAKRGQWFGFLIAAITVIAGSLVAAHGEQAAGGLIGTGGVVALATVFVIGRRSSPPQKSEAPTPPTSTTTS